MKGSAPPTGDPRRSATPPPGGVGSPRRPASNDPNDTSSGDTPSGTASPDTSGPDDTGPGTGDSQDPFASIEWGPDLFAALEWWRPTDDRPSRRWWAIAAVLVAVLAAGYLVAGRRDTAVAPFDITGLEPSLQVDLSEPPTLGEAAVLTVTGLAETDQPRTRISVLHTTSAGAYRTERWVVPTGDTAELSLATQPMREAGQHSLVVFTDRQRGQLDLWLDPASSRPGFTPVIGPTRVTADTAQVVVVTITSSDQFGNGLADDTEVELVVRRPNGAVDEYSGTIDRLLAGIEVPVTAEVGTVSVVATIDGVPSEPVEFEQVPGPAATLELIADETSIVADGRSVLPIRATNVADSNGHQVVDGTVLEAKVTSPSGSGQIDAEVINGEAVFLLRAPTEPGVISFVLQALEADAVSYATTIVGSPAAEDFAVIWDAANASATVGPVTAPTGGFVADGATVDLLIDGAVATSGQVLDGYSTLTSPAGSITSDSRVEVRVLGVTKPVTR